jgi:REP element-mobilizing transposase RayT
VNRDATPEHPIRRNLRLPGYDYTSEGTYFVTICTQDRRRVLGEVIDGSFQANAAGNIVKECWCELPYHYAGLALDAFVVMPNHMHGVLAFLDDVGAGLKPALGIKPRRSLSEVVRAFKTFSARRINELRGTRGVAVWQRAYYEHIVRGEKGLSEIRRYIADNPGNWEMDRENLR